MSKFSGKCDFYDIIQIHGLETILNSTIYVGDNNDPLKLTSIKDCIPYYPHIVGMAAFDNNVGKSTIWLSPESWVDSEEKMYGHIAVHDMYRELLKEEIEKYSLEERD